MTMFRPLNEEKSTREYKKPSSIPLFAEITDKKFEKLEEKPTAREFNSKLIEKNLSNNKNNPNDRLCGLAPKNFDEKTIIKENPEPVEKEAKTEDDKGDLNSEENLEPVEKEANDQKTETEKIDEARKAAYQDGFVEGKKEGAKIAKELGINQGKKEGIEEGKKAEQPKIEKKGFDLGFDEAKKELEKKITAKENSLENLINSLKKSGNDLNSFFNPLKKLSLHIAKEIVRSELTTSNIAIENSIINCISELREKGDQPVLVKMNEEDHKAYAQFIKKLDKSVKSVVDKSLQMGDIKVAMGDSSIEDLIKNRVEEICRQLQLDDDESKKFQVKFKKNTFQETKSGETKKIPDTNIKHESVDLAEESKLEETTDAFPIDSISNEKSNNNNDTLSDKNSELIEEKDQENESKS